MDFGRPMVLEAGLAARSNIRIVPETHLGNDPIDIMLCRSANDAARELFLGNGNPPSKKLFLDSAKKSVDNGDGVDGQTNSKEGGDDEGDRERQLLRIVDSSLYPERHLPPPRATIRPGDLAVVFESFNALNFVYTTPGAIFSNRNGHFHHNDFIGRPYGCKIRSRNNSGLGYLYLLRPTPELWARSLPHRTQIVHELDASIIVYYLELAPGMTVCESGTGSGAMSHAIARCVAPRGRLHTYEFNRVRVEKARREFLEHGLEHLVQVHFRDVCGNEAAKATALSTGSDEEKQSGGDDGEEEDDGKGGFNLPHETKAHAIFLDLPQPWLAVPHAAHAIAPTGRIGSYSPCVEQTQRTVDAMKRCGFHSIRTIEVRLKEYFVDEVQLEPVPTEVLDLPDVSGTHGVPISLESAKAGVGNDGERSNDRKTEAKEGENAPAVEENRCGGNIKRNGGDGALHTQNGVEGGVKRKLRTEEDPSSTSEGASQGSKVLCARPFPQMRGHTAFLTFATAGISLRPDPNMVATSVEEER